MAGRPATSETAPTRLGALLGELRDRAGMTREELAARARLSSNTLMKVEQGATRDPGFLKVAAICRSLRFSLDELGALTLADIDSGDQMTHGIVSIGYEGSTIDKFVDRLTREGVATFFDVRLNAISRKPGFSKTKLADALRSAGIDYRHLPSLGNRKDNREPFLTGRLDEGRAAYRASLDPAAVADLEQIAGMASSGVVAVACFEADHSRCHRYVVIDEIRRFGSVPVKEL